MNFEGGKNKVSFIPLYYEKNIYVNKISLLLSRQLVL